MLSSSENFQTNLEKTRLKSESDPGISNPDGWSHNRRDNFLNSSNYNAKRSSSKIFSDQYQPRLIIPLPVLLKDRLLISDKKFKLGSQSKDAWINSTTVGSNPRLDDILSQKIASI